MKNDSFFDESTEQSQVKTTIVSKYFSVWAKIILSNRRVDKIAYVDLFAGPGRYKDGTTSTPILVIKKAIADSKLKDQLITIFNDADSKNTNSLEQLIQEIPEINKLRHKPIIHNETIGKNIIKVFGNQKFIPTLFFIDPWGYKGLSLDLINSIIKDWGCDCIFFFNYNRINMGLGNPFVKEHMDALFGDERADQLREQLTDFSPDEREFAIIEAICEALKETGKKFVLPFRFKNKQGERTSHHLIFVSKHVKGYEIMKEIMAKESSTKDQGVPSFEYNQATLIHPFLFELSKPLDDLEEMLLQDFAGKKLIMKQIYEQHHVGKRYIETNYKGALASLEAQNKIITKPPANKRRKRLGKVTFADTVMVTFP